MRTQVFTINPHEDIELGFQRTKIDYYVNFPIGGINDQTGVILSIPGFGGTANSEYYLNKLNPYLADKYDCIVVSMNYFGIFRGVKTELDEIFIKNMEEIYGVSKDYWCDISSDNDFYSKIVKILDSKGLFTLDTRCQALKITERGEYQSFGFLPALDCLTILGDVLRKFPNLNTRKIIAYGSSYGGYIAMLCGKFAPNTFSVIIDNSGFSRAELKYIASREISANDYVLSIRNKDKAFSIPFSYNNPWTILDETSPYYFGDAKKLIRSLLVQEHRFRSDTRYYLFHCEEDNISSVDDKDRVVSLLLNYNFTYFKRVKEEDIDGYLFKEYGHAMAASLRKLFDHVVELDKQYGLIVEEPLNDFYNNEVYCFKCGTENYVFKYSDDFKVKVERIDNVKKEYKLIPLLQFMPQILEITNTIIEGVDFVASSVSQAKYNDASVVMKDILDAYDIINLRIKPFLVHLPKNNLVFLDEEVKNSLIDTIEYFKASSWIQLEDAIVKRVRPNFLLWKNELSDTFMPYMSN